MFSYDLPFSHNTFVTDEEDGRTDDNRAINAYSISIPPIQVKGRHTETSLVYYQHSVLHLDIVFFCTRHCRHVYNHYWSGVFNLLKFGHTPKKKKKLRVKKSVRVFLLIL